MSHQMIPIVVAALSYLTGAIPFGYLVARWRGVNIFEKGSGNIGATNVGRILGRKFGVLVFLLDFAKGAIPVAVAGRFGQPAGIDLPPDSLRVLTGLCAFLGHLFPVYLRFRGGKGVATGAGVVAVLLPFPMVAALIDWLAVVVSFRMVSLASLAAVVFLCGWRLMVPAPFATGHVVLTSFCLLVTALVFVRHRSNIARLMNGNENQLRENRVMANVARIVHVLSLGLWFGMSVFFNFVVGISLFETFWSIGKLDDRPKWFPLPQSGEYQRDPTLWQAAAPADRPFANAEEVRREQGTRAAGAAVGPLLTIYFSLSGFCGLLALVTSMGWSIRKPGSRVHRLRTWFLVAALLTVLIGWPLERIVAKVNADRNTAVDHVLAEYNPNADVLADNNPNADMLAQATEAKHNFVLWHTASLALSLVGVVLVTVGMGLAARLPSYDASGPM
jgi:glycerol-3-phosphate acyltransferase PlsY